MKSSKGFLGFRLHFSALICTLYFGALGLVLQELGVSLTAYLASASVLGLAIGFGSQGVVQDVVTGLTVILSDLFQVGDMVEIADKPGIVQSISMRFTTLLDPDYEAWMVSINNEVSEVPVAIETFRPRAGRASTNATR